MNSANRATFPTHQALLFPSFCDVDLEKSSREELNDRLREALSAFDTVEEPLSFPLESLKEHLYAMPEEPTRENVYGL